MATAERSICVGTSHLFYRHGTICLRSWSIFYFAMLLCSRPNNRTVSLIMPPVTMLETCNCQTSTKLHWQIHDLDTVSTLATQGGPDVITFSHLMRLRSGGALMTSASGSWARYVSTLHWFRALAVHASESGAHLFEPSPWLLVGHVYRQETMQDQRLLVLQKKYRVYLQP